MSPRTSCRLIVDPPASGAWNMAVDEMLLERAAEGDECCLRLYRWKEPTLSLGYFQRWEDRRQHHASRDCPVVRRASGGGAILHDKELTYSLVLPSKHRLARRRLFLYEAVHRTLIEVLEELGVRARLFDKTEKVDREAQPFLCFQRRSPGDMLVDTSKIVGSAQRRSRGAVLQHGSLLLARSSSAPELDGLGELGAFSLDEEALIAGWLKALAERLELSWARKELAGDDLQRIDVLVTAKYGNVRWTRNRGRRSPQKRPE